MPVAIPRQYQAEVVSNEQLTPKIWWTRFRPETPVDYLAGQYASFLIDNARRPLSFATPPGAELEFVVDVSPNGIASQYIKKLRPRDTVTFLAPYGRFVIEEVDHTRPLVFMASGSGIAPIRAQIQVLLTQSGLPPISLVFGNRSEEFMFFFDEFTRVAAQHPSFQFIPCCSQPSSQWPGERGLVTEVTLRRVPELPAAQIFVCGGPAMVTAAAAMLQEQGVPPTQIHTEKFI